MLRVHAIQRSLDYFAAVRRSWLFIDVICVVKSAGYVHRDVSRKDVSRME